MIPKYSIIVSIYNIQDYLKQCVDSILRQTITDFELILVDDGSKDESGKICDEYAKVDSRVSSLHKENGGLSDARNYGLNAAKGKWIYFVDGDDWLQPTTLEDFDSLINQYNDVDFVHGRFTVFYTKSGSSELIPNYIDNKWALGKTGQQVFVEAHKRDLPVTMGIRGVYNRDFLIKNNLYFVKSLYAEDEEWTPRLFYYANRLCGCESGGYIYRANRVGSLMNTLNLKKLLDLITIYVEWFNFVNRNKCIEEYKSTIINEGYKRTYWAFESALNSLNKNDFKKFIVALKQNGFLIGDWKSYSDNARFLFFCYSISIRNCTIGYLFYKICRIPEKVISKVLRRIRRKTSN